MLPSDVERPPHARGALYRVTGRYKTCREAEGEPVVKRTRFSEYKDSYEHYKFELSPEGILFMQCHTNGGPLEWYWESHDRMADAFADIAGDREIKVVIHTGTGDTYNALWGKPVTADQKPLYIAYDDAEGVSIMDEKVVVRPHDHREPVGHRRAHDRGGQRPVHHALRGAAAHGHRARIRGRVLPGPVALPARDGAGRRSARRVGSARRPRPCPCPAAHRLQADRPGSPRMGRRLGGAPQGQAGRPRVGDRAATSPCVRRSRSATPVTSSPRT